MKYMLCKRMLNVSAKSIDSGQPAPKLFAVGKFSVCQRTILSHGSFDC